jgi:hypothetical protein
MIFFMWVIVTGKSTRHNEWRRRLRTFDEPSRLSSAEFFVGQGASPGGIDGQAKRLPYNHIIA